jgi:hypothetical protein
MRSLARALAFFALCSLPAHAELYPTSWTPIQINAWGGLNLLNDSTALGNDAQKAQNVLTDNGYLEKRPGNIVLGTILPGYSNKYADDWVSPNGTRYLLAHSSDTVYRTDFSASPVALGTVTANANISSISAFSRRYFADGVVPPWYWDGSSTATLVSAAGVAAPICTYMAFKDSRVFCANIPNDGRSRVRISSAGGAGYWVVPPDVANVDNAPNVFDFTPDDGDSVNCMATTPWGVFIGKRYSSWMIKGTGNLSYSLRILDPKIGCVDNHSVQMVNGVLEWLSITGVYGFNGAAAPELLSRELDPMLRGLAFAAARPQEWRVDTKSEFNDGNLMPLPSGPGAPMSVTILPGSVTPSTFSHVDVSSQDFANGVLVNLTTETLTGYLMLSSHTFRDDWVTGSYTIGQTTWTASGSFSAGSYGLKTAGNGTNVINSTQVNISTGHWQFSYHYQENVTPNNTCNQSGGVICLGFRFSKKTNGDYYSLEVSPAGGSSSHNVSIMKSVGGVRTHLSDSILQINSEDIVNFIIERSTDGRIFASTATATFTNAVMIASTTDTSVSAAGANYTEMSMEELDTSKVWTQFISNLYAWQYYPVGTFTSPIFDTGVTTPTWSAIHSTFTARNDISEGNIAFYVQTSTAGDGGGFGSYVSSSDTIKIAAEQKRFVRYREDFTTSITTKTPTLSAVSLLAATTGYYNSPVHFIGSAITSYGLFAVTQVLPNGSTNTFSVRATTYSFTDLSGVNIPWVAQTANQIVNVAVSTPTYMQWRALLDFNQAENAPSIARVATNFNEGTSKPVASGVQERRYFLCVTVSSASTNNDTCVVRQMNGKWVTWTGPLIGSMGLYDNNLIVGDGGISGKVWKTMQSGVYGDDGSAIDSQWVSNDYTNGSIFNNKVLHEFWVDALPVALSSVTLSYQVNKSSGFVDSTFYLDNGQPVNANLRPTGFALYGQINQWVPLFSGYDEGKYVRVKFSDALLNNYWRINSYLLYLENQGRQVPN